MRGRCFCVPITGSIIGSGCIAPYDHDLRSVAESFQVPANCRSRRAWRPPMTNVSYADKVVIITGGSSGIGKGCAEQFVRAGARVVICCNNEAEGAEVAAALRDAAQGQGFGDADFVYSDVTRTEEVRNLIETT